MVVKLIKNKRGQAFFEMIVFIPFMLYLFTLIVTFGNSVNGGINQNKLTRGAFYHLLSHNSMAPRSDFMSAFAAQGTNVVGMFVVGYREDRDGEQSIASCYRVNRVFGGNVDEECEDPPPSTEETNQIRIYTLYGLCTASFRMTGANPEYEDYMANSIESCMNRGI